MPGDEQSAFLVNKSVNGLLTSSVRRMWVSRVAFLVGAILIATACVVIVRERESISPTLDSIKATRPAVVVGYGCVLVATVCANVVLTGIMFRLLMSRYGQVGWFEMQALVATSALLNYLPLRPGLLGRVAYHKAVNQIAIRDSVKVVIQAVFISVLIAAYIACAIVFVSALHVSVWVCAFIPIPLIVASMWLASDNRILLSAALVRYIDLLAVACRYYVIFALIGVSLSFDGALAFAGISLVVTLVPFLSNGMGVREWAVGGATPLVSNTAWELGLTADLLSRAVELIVILIVGLVGWTYIVRHMRHAQSVSDQQSTPG